VLSFLATLEFKYPAVVGVGLFVAYLAFKRRPSAHGWLAALLCLYLPVSGRFPLAFGFGLNLLNIFYVLLLLAGLRHDRLRQGDVLRTTAVAWALVCTLSFGVAVFIGSATGLGDRVALLKRWLDPLILYLLMRQLEGEADRAAALNGVVAGTVLFSVHLALQGLDMGHKERVGGLMDQANDAGAFVAAYSPILLALLASSSFGKKLMLLAALAVCAFAEIQTVSRAGFIGFVVGLVAAGTFSRSRFSKVLVWGLLIAGLVSPTLLPDKVSSRFAGHDLLGQQTNEAAVSMEGRYEIWNAGVAMGLSNPLGVGLGEFHNRIGQYGGPEQRDAHNLYLLVWAEMGFFGVAVLLVLMLQLFLRGQVGSRSGNDPISKLAGIGLMAAVIALLVTNFFSVSVRDIAVFGYVWVLAGVIRRVNPVLGNERIRRDLPGTDRPDAPAVAQGLSVPGSGERASGDRLRPQLAVCWHPQISSRAFGMTGEWGQAAHEDSTIAARKILQRGYF
jgi:O-antigen ligase